MESTLYAARAEAVARGAEAPGHVNEPGLADRLTAIGAALSERPARARGETGQKNNLGDLNAPTALLLGCAYLKDPELLAAVVKLAEHLLGSVRILNACCGAPWLHLGRPEEARQARRDLKQKLRGAQQLIVADPGCMVTLGASTDITSRLLLDVAVEEKERFSRLPASAPEPPYRWHDPCQLGRGLGRYTEPRLLLEQLNGARPLEFTAAGEDAACSGGGGALPRTLPGISADIADARIADHSALGGGTIVTACGSSLRRFRSRGASAVDLHQLLARALPDHG
ncbi:MAG: (Fe-S)-binding protein [Polyangiaceae bacterium]|nr:(Fe-S)-binding protein [Polyangiaceae bacterium]